jgi:hypothetical protein
MEEKMSSGWRKKCAVQKNSDEALACLVKLYYN